MDMEQKSEKLGYENAVKELESLAAKIESPDYGLESISADLKRALELVEYCKKELKGYEEEIGNLVKQ